MSPQKRSRPGTQPAFSGSGPFTSQADVSPALLGAMHELNRVSAASLHPGVFNGHHVGEQDSGCVSGASRL